CRLGPGDISAGEMDAPGIELDEAGRCQQRRTLAGTCRPEQRQNLVFPHFEVQAPQRRLAGIGLLQSFEMQHDRHSTVSPVTRRPVSASKNSSPAGSKRTFPDVPSGLERWSTPWQIVSAMVKVKNFSRPMPKTLSTGMSKPGMSESTR